MSRNRNGLTLWIVVFCLFKLQAAKTENTGYFWHVTDHHWDPYYSPGSSSPTEVCPSSYGQPVMNPGPLGDHRCDSPWPLIQSSIDAMKRIYPDPDYILWTGDDTLHTSDQDRFLGKDIVLDIIRNVSQAIKDSFPKTPVFPALGNHDYYPKHQIPPEGSDILTAIAEMWQSWLPNGTYEMFRQEGYYVNFLPGSDQHIIVILNTNFWYVSNKAVDGSGDPGNEFQWMEQVLQNATEKAQKVYVAGHIPPGYAEIPSYNPFRWFYKNYNQQFLHIVRKHKDVIAGMFFGHHHTDHFKVMKDYDSNIVRVGRLPSLSRVMTLKTMFQIQSLLVAPGVTPWTTVAPGVVNGSSNPGIRLFKYDRDTLKLLDFTQYYLNLDEANGKKQHDPGQLWIKEYTATTTYGIPDITTSSWAQLAISMRQGCENNECPQNFLDYHRLNTVSHISAECNETCLKFQLCGINEVETAPYERCMKDWDSSATALKTKMSTWVFSTIGVVLLPRLHNL